MPLASSAAFDASMDCEHPTDCCESSSSHPTLGGLAPTLTLQPMTPLRFHKGVDAALRLDRIEWLEIVDAQRNPTDNTTYYTINVFTRKEQSRLPITRLAHKPVVQRPVDPMAKPSRQCPDFSIQRSFADFKQLRDDTLHAVLQSHGRSCRLCNDFQSLMVFTSTRPAMALKSLLPTGTRRKVLQKLLVSLVAQFQVREATAGRRDGCQAAHEIPVVLYQFLFDEEQ